MPALLDLLFQPITNPKRVERIILKIITNCPG